MDLLESEMSCMENPHNIPSQDSDQDLILEERNKMVSCTNSKGKIKKALNDILDQFEREQIQQTHVFWRSIFHKIIMDQHPTLRLLHKSLTDEEEETEEETEQQQEDDNDSCMDEGFVREPSCQRDVSLKKEIKPLSILTDQTMIKTSEKKRKELSEDEDEEENPGKKQRSSSMWDNDEEQPASSSQLTPDKEIKTEEQTEQQHEDDHDSCMHDENVNEASFQTDVSLKDDIKSLSVLTDATMIKTSEKEQTDEHCQNEFSEDEDEEENPGKKQRSSSMCDNDEEQPGPSSQLTPDEEDETEEQTEQQHEDDDDCYIYDETVKEASRQTDVSLNKEIMWEGKPLSVLTELSEKEQRDEHKQKELSEDEEENPGKKQRSNDNDNEQPGPSSQLTPASPLKNGETDDVQALILNKSQLPVNCGDLKATLYKDRLEKGEECISFQNQWFTPGKFETFAGKGRSKNWKLSIRHNGISLRKLLDGGHLKSGTYIGGCKKAKKSQEPSDQSSPDEETEEQTDQQQEDDNDGSKTVFKVTCGAVAGILHKKRFASGTCGKSIRTETSWLSPVEFVKEASGQTDAYWRKDIKCEEKPLSVLIEENTLSMHSLLCGCELCKADQEDLENQKNDDECCVCKSDEEADLVVCDHCPRSFHQKCHLPEVEDAILGDDKKWRCTFCVFKTTEEWRHSYFDELEMEAAMSQQISQHMLECQYLLLYLCSADEEQMFASNPNNSLENYSTVVQTPMWFGKVAKKLQKKKYQTVEEFVSDVQLIFTNCAAYYRDDAEFFARGSRLKELFDGEFKKVFNINEQTVD